MLLFGIKRTQLKSHTLKSDRCPQCHSNINLQACVYGKHLHFFKIPLFPFRKFGQMECSNCNTTLDKYNVPQIIKSQINILLSESHFKVYQYTGLTVLLLAAFLYQNNQTQIQHYQKRIESSATAISSLTQIEEQLQKTNNNFHPMPSTTTKNDVLPYSFLKKEQRSMAFSN